MNSSYPNAARVLHVPSAQHMFSLVMMCRVLKVARAGFSQWLISRYLSGRKEDARLVEAVRHSYTASGGVYGANRVFGDLREAGETCGRDRIARLMQVNKIEAVRGYKVPRRNPGTRLRTSSHAGPRCYANNFVNYYEHIFPLSIESELSWKAVQRTS